MKRTLAKFESKKGRFEISAQANEADIYIYGVIDSTEWWGDEVLPQHVAAALQTLPSTMPLNIHVNSPGGNVFAGMAIYALLDRHAGQKTSYIEGLAASMGSVIPLVADKRYIARGSMYMIHQARGTVRQAIASEMRRYADLLDKLNGEMGSIYKAKSKLDNIDELLGSGTDVWYTADEAKAAGFVDSIEGELEVAACLLGDTAIINGVEVDWRQFSNAPSLPKVGSPEAVDFGYKAAARRRELELKFRR